jgi:hypothetical protein
VGTEATRSGKAERACVATFAGRIFQACTSLALGFWWVGWPLALGPSQREREGVQRGPKMVWGRAKVRRVQERGWCECTGHVKKKKKRERERRRVVSF